MLKYAKKYLPIETVEKVYTSIVKPHFKICCLVCGCRRKLQNRAARLVTRSFYNALPLPLHGSLECLAIIEIIIFETAPTVYKSLHGLAPE